ncbi:hypothetical protein [Sporosalibacterium faouarense]|uniref:hypothetical protein n=1 Tax=Sporosalibacterium faouarense TaxID=516123 RepID=UPI00141D72D6|nr:hypothetical protein [Sporosalibacterium faouarense]MTI48598.1 hypothetical protein [Bacillota bacterium]
MTTYGENRKYYKTIIAILIISLVIIGIHMMFNLSVQTQTFSEEWGRSIQVGTSENSWNPLIGDLGDKLLTTTFNKDGSINYFLLEKSGEVIKSGKVEDETIKVTSKWNVDLVDDKLFYVEGKTLYLNQFESEAGFGNPKTVFKEVTKFDANKIGNKSVIQAFNKDKVYISEMINGKVKNIITLDNIWNLYKVIYKEIDNKQYIFLVNKPNNNMVEVLYSSIENGEAQEIKKLGEKQLGTNSSLNDFEITELNNKYYLLYEATQVSGGARSVYGDIRIIDKNTLNEESKKYIMQGDIDYVSEVGEDFLLHKNDSKVQLITTGLNQKNKYAVKPDVFKLEIKEDGNLSEPEFLSNTESISIKPAIMATNHGEYLIFLDITSGTQYALNVNSNNDIFVANAQKLTKSDYISAFLKAITAPIFAFTYIIMTTGIINITYIVFAFLGVFAIIKMLNIRKEKLKLALFIITYILINFIRFDNNFYLSSAIAMMPDILTTSIVPYVMPILINLITGLVTYLFYKERKKSEYFPYIIFFIVLDLYLSNLIYVPFNLFKSLAQ